MARAYVFCFAKNVLTCQYVCAKNWPLLTQQNPNKKTQTLTMNILDSLFILEHNKSKSFHIFNYSVSVSLHSIHTLLLPSILAKQHSTAHTTRSKMSMAVEEKKRKRRKNTHTHLFYTGAYILSFPVDSHQRGFKWAQGRPAWVRLPYWLMGLTVHSNLLRLIRDGGMGTYVVPPTRYTVTSRITLH